MGDLERNEESMRWRRAERLQGGSGSEGEDGAGLWGRRGAPARCWGLKGGFETELRCSSRWWGSEGHRTELSSREIEEQKQKGHGWSKEHLLHSCIQSASARDD